MKALRMKIYCILLVAVALISLAGQPAYTQPGTAVRQSDDTDFRARIAAVYQVWKMNDGEINWDAIQVFYAPDVVVFDVAPFERSVGFRSYRQGLERGLFANTLNYRQTPNDDVQVTRKGNVAWATLTYQASVQSRDKRTSNIRGRQTLIWEHRNGRWLVVQEHNSVPASL